MKYLSICSGIEAATVAWHQLGWEPVAFSEIEPFPSAVLRHHYATVANVGDMTRFKEWNIGSVDLLVGGTPCQAFSVAGLRQGLADARGNLTLTFVQMADHFDPEWIVWENVPGVFSSKDNAFGCFLAGLCGTSEPIVAERGWDNAGLATGPKRTVAWRILDAQFFGVAQRRRRVFVLAVRGARNWRSAAALFPVSEGLFWNFAPRREAGKVAPTIPSRSTSGGGLGTDFDCDGGVVQQPYQVANRLTQRMHKGINSTVDEGQTPIIAHALRGEGFDASEDGTGRGTSLVTQAVGVTIHGTDGTVRVASFTETSSALRSRIPSGVENSTTTAVMQSMQVRRLTPVECERLQGFPDGYTNIPWRKQPESPDGPRYKALGNSMAVPVMRWLGERIAFVRSLA